MPAAVALRPYVWLLLAVDRWLAALLWPSALRLPMRGLYMAYTAGHTHRWGRIVSTSRRQDVCMGRQRRALLHWRMHAGALLLPCVTAHLC